MQYIPIKTRVMNPPQDDLFKMIDESNLTLQEEDILVLSSKVVAIHEGRCIKELDFDKDKHIKSEADVIIPRENWGVLTIINNVIVGSAGVDRSNSGGYYTLLPKEPFKSAEVIYKYLLGKFNLNKLGVIISDSRSHPCRFGATGCGIGFWGISPVVYHQGTADLFGRKITHEKSNLVDGIVAGANVVMGEVAESTPLVIAREVPQITFKGGNLKSELFCDFEEDILKVLYQDYL